MTFIREFNNIVEENQSFVYNFILNKVNNPLIAEELTNDVFMKVYKYHCTPDNKLSYLKTWLTKVIKSTTIDYWRKKKLEFDNIDNIDTTYFTNNSTPHIELSNKEMFINIKMAILNLPVNQKRVATLFFLHGYKLKLIAIRLSMPLNTVKTAIYNIRKTLQNDLKYEIV